MVSSPRVSIVIVNHNGEQYLEGCLRSVLSQEGIGFETILVDNGSTDNSVTFVRSAFPNIRIVENHRNLGFAAGNNLGVEEARGEYIAFLNNDVKVERNWLRELIEPLESDRADLVSSLVLTEGISSRYYEKNGTLSLLGYNIMRVFDDRETLFYVTGCAMAFRRRDFPKPFDDDYVFYSEDTYLSLRARFLGLRLMQASRSVVQHVGSGTAGRLSRRVRTFYQERNRLLNILLFFENEMIMKLMPMIVVSFAARSVHAVFSLLIVDKRRQKSLLGVLQGYLWFPTHIRKVRQKRRAIHEEKRVKDEEVISLMSCKVTNAENLLGRVLNRMACTYCRFSGIRTVEFRESV
jgi:GT2 family glycosyltransferase